MKLREFINSLEELSQNGKNDDLDVRVWNSIEDISMVDDIKYVYLDTYISPNDEYDYVLINI